MAYTTLFMEGTFLSTYSPYVWYSGCLKPPELTLEDECLYQMILFVNSVGIVSGFYDHGKNQFCQNCERYDDIDDEKPDYINYVDNINHNLEWTYEPVEKVLYWMLIPAPAIPEAVDQRQIDFRLN